MTAANPFESAHGERARTAVFQLLAATGGAAGDFAEDVLAGRRQPHELLAHRPVLEEFLHEARGWRQVLDALPAEERHRLARDAATSLEHQVEELATLDVDAAAAELRELAARMREPEVPQPEVPRPARRSPADENDWSSRTYLEEREW